VLLSFAIPAWVQERGVRSFCQDRLAPVAPLRYMVWNPRKDDARESGHVGTISWGIGIMSPDCPPDYPLLARWKSILRKDAKKEIDESHKCNASHSAGRDESPRVDASGI
jgi:hypothetical protein